MASVAEDIALDGLNVNPDLFAAVKDSVDNALGMCGIKVRCVGVSAIPTTESGIITGMIGIHGKVSGFLSVNVPEQLAIRAVEGLLHEQYGKLTSQVIDGAGEITNIIVGGTKAALASTKWGFSNITVPSVIVGESFTIAYARGLEFLSVSFEQEDADVVRLEDRMIHVSLSLLKLT